MDSMQVIVKMIAKPGRTERLEEIIRGVMPSVRENEPGTTIYDYHRNKAHPEEFLVHEAYESSEAFIKHCEAGGLLLEMIEQVDLQELLVLGKPSSEALETLTALSQTNGVTPLYFYSEFELLKA